MADIKHTHSILYTNLSNISLYYLFKSILIHQHLPFGSHKQEITKLLPNLSTHVLVDRESMKCCVKEDMYRKGVISNMMPDSCMEAYNILYDS